MFVVPGFASASSSPNFMMQPFCFRALPAAAMRMLNQVAGRPDLAPAPTRVTVSAWCKRRRSTSDHSDLQRPPPSLCIPRPAQKCSATGMEGQRPVGWGLGRLAGQPLPLIIQPILSEKPRLLEPAAPKARSSRLARALAAGSHLGRKGKHDLV